MAGEVEAFDLVVGEEEGEGVFQEVDPLEQVEDIDLFEHLLPCLVVVAQLVPLRLAAERPQHRVEQLPQVVEKVVALLQLFSSFLAAVEVASQVYLVLVGIVRAHQEESDDYRTEKPADVSKYFVNLLKGAIVGKRNWRFEEKEYRISIRYLNVSTL